MMEAELHKAKAWMKDSSWIGGGGGGSKPVAGKNIDKLILQNPCEAV